MSRTDEFFMRNAIALARRGLGRTWPNPSVGAVVVRPGDNPELVARGVTGAGGRPHAERIALDKLDGAAGGCTLYVSLEPCAHHGKTAPCAEAIVDAGISRVVCALEDPDERVSGSGFSILEQAGIAITRGVLADEARHVAAGHISRVTQCRPWVEIKLATGKDGLLPRGDGRPVWVTGEIARAHAHLVRSQADAILIGSGTVAADDPELTCRLPGMSGASPIRVLLSASGKVEPGSRLVKTIDTAPLWVMVAPEQASKVERALGAVGADIIPVKTRKDSSDLDLSAVLTELALRGITRLLVEGGARVATSFYELGLADEILDYRAIQPAGNDGIAPLGKHGLDSIAHGREFELAETRHLGNDTLIRYRRIGKQ